LGGLTLARVLVKRGVPFTLYERTSCAPRHGYGITLHAYAYRPLLELLNMDETTFKRCVAVDATLGGTGRMNPKRLVQPGLVGSDCFRAHCARLEDLLREGLEVRWDHKVEKVERTDGGSTLWLSNGQRIEQTCLVGADGVHASTRNSLLPNAKLNVLPFVTFNGKRRVKRSIFDGLYAPVMKDSNVLEERINGTLLQISLNDIAEDTVSLSWVFSRTARGPGDPLYKPNRPPSGATEIPDDFFEEVRSLTGLGQPFKDVFDTDKLNSDRVLSWLMRTTEVESADLESLARHGIFIVGDAAHAQPILGGEGASAAISDAVGLAGMIAANDPQVLSDWYRSKLPIWSRGTEKSKVHIDMLHNQ